MAQTAADVIVDRPTQAGAKRGYGVPGDALNHITDAVRRLDIRWVHGRKHVVKP